MDRVTIGRVVARREVLGLFATAAGVAAVAAHVPDPLSRMSARRRALASGAATALGPASAARTTAVPSCVVRPEQTEGPYFVDEKLNRSDVRSDPTDGSIKQGVQLALTFAVSRLDGSACVPFAGVVVDVWHCDAAGIYSDVQDPRFDTTGKKFLRGHQVIDASGTATFVTIYPGSYQGRTVHIHFKIRSHPDADQGLEFTSQLYFDDGLTDVVHARQPYATHGQRTLRNDGDGIYRNGGDRLLLTLADDGSGGYVTTFDIGIQVGGTTTTLPAGSCATIATCLADLQRALPDPAGATNRKARRTARNLHRRSAKMAQAVSRAAASVDGKRAKQYARARAGLQALLAATLAADGKATLGVPLVRLRAAIDALLGQLPS